MATSRALGAVPLLLLSVVSARSTPSARKCPVSTAAFTHAINGTQCLNLTRISARTADDCQCACAESFGCATWVFGSQADDCWIGSVPCDGAHNAAWTGASKLPVGADPPACKGPGPLAHIVEGIGCSGLQAEKELHTPDECAAACCGSEKCLTWVFDSAGGLQGVKCWMGDIPCSSGSASPEWSGSSKVPVTAAPHPPAPPPPPLPPLPPFSTPRLSPRPTKVAGAPEPLVSLNGEWSFKPNKTTTVWSKILVPSEYTLQGYRVPAGTPVVYERQFVAPPRPATARLKLRSDGCYSQCNVSVNGQSVGSHLGGFTPFEMDVTDAVSTTSSQNTITIELVGHSLADTMASGSQYASHDLGGITRKTYLMVLPEVSIADINYTATVADGRDSATIVATVTFANDGSGSAPAGSAQVTLCSRGPPTPAHSRSLVPDSCQGQPIVASNTVHFGGLAAGSQTTVTTTFSVQNTDKQPLRLWDPEHPHLHTLQVDLGDTQQSAIRLGIRQVVLHGNTMLVNGRPIKGRGTTRHETHAFFGRSLWNVAPEGGQWERDILAFRDLNVNWIRTSHYPPAEELMEAADEYGMFIELEMPLCWDRSVGDDAFYYTIQVHSEAVHFNRHHPSVIAWSLANESPWTPTFTTSLNSVVKRIDSSRPFMFDGGSGQTMRVAGGQLDIETAHYPGLRYDFEHAPQDHPISFGEFAHLNCYNHRELLTDEGLRVNWAMGTQRMIEHVLESTVLAACYWAGIDDQFYMPALSDGSRHLVGYGPWGVIDNFRRMKPESIACRNMYSPFVIEQLQNGSRLIDLSHITVHNRFDFTDLAELNITWQSLDATTAGEHHGLGHAKGPPHSRGNTLVLEGLDATATRRIELNVTSPRSFLINTWHLGAEPSSYTEHLPLTTGLAEGPPVVKANADGSLSITAGEVAWTVSAGGSVSASQGGASILAGGPVLMVLATHTNDFSQLTESNDRSYSPATDTLDGWTADSKPTFKPVGSNAVCVTVTGSYAKQAHGGFELTFDSTGRLQVSYAFTWIGAPISPRQIGVVFDLAQGVEHLSWKRRGQFTYYGTSDIGRNEASDVLPRPCGTYFGFSGDACGYSSATLWSDDSTPMGTADFRSTRDAVLTYSLCSHPQERGCFRLLGNGTVNGEPGTLSARAWLNGSSVRLLAATLSNEGGNSFTQPIAILPHVKLANGSSVRGEVVVQVQ